ncbi:MAG: hypothetical protein J5821_02320 [Alphaproteobacteria bacterium]|nr:hypothetical protein [Alphaproteobacteria bacterium]
MKLRNLICNGLCVFLVMTDVNAMSFNKPSDSGNSQSSRRGNNSTLFGLCKNVQQLKKDVNTQMLGFHRSIQSFESDIYTQTLALRHHFWQIEMIVENQVSREINAKTDEKVPGLDWSRWTVESEMDGPLFKLRVNIQQFGATFHTQASQLMQNLQQLSQRSSHCKSRVYNKLTLMLNQDVEQFNLIVDEHLFGLHNDVKRLESLVEEQLFELRQDVDFLKSKIDISWSELCQFMASKTHASWSGLQHFLRSDTYASWHALRQYVRCLELMSDKNMRGLHQDVSSLLTLIYEDVSLLHQNARLLQMNVCGEFSYKYNRFLRRR